MIALALLLATQAAPADTDAPLIEDVAAAASNPDAAPVITVMMSDRGSGVGTALVHFRPPGGEWQKADLKGGTSGLFIARLPDGAQRTGFEYWIEASDIAGNGPTRIASPDRPIVVEKATEPTMVRVERQRAAAAAAPVHIHPAWLMLSLGVGVAAGAGAGAFGLDIGNVQSRIDREQPTGARAAELEQARTIDVAAAATLGVVAVAGLGTGVVLVVLSSLE
ncbi:MAG: hypothetical protein HYS27_05730 [Deltaproteobacteria bacterium]|nr:hypothetical protein [Deltaproteobacteria bacterium]